MIAELRRLRDLPGRRHQCSLLATQTEMLGEPTDKKQQHAGPFDAVKVSRNVPRGDERGACERDSDRPYAPSAPRAPSAHADGHADREDEEHQVVKFAQPETDAEHGEQLRIGRQASRANRAGEYRQNRGPQAVICGAGLRGSMGSAIASVAVLVDVVMHRQRNYPIWRRRATQLHVRRMVLVDLAVARHGATVLMRLLTLLQLCCM